MKFDEMFHESRVQTKQEEQKGEETPVSVTVKWGNKQRREREMLDGFLYVY